MTKRELIAEHRECDRQTNRIREVLYKLLHIRRRGCPLCMKLRRRGVAT